MNVSTLLCEKDRSFLPSGADNLEDGQIKNVKILGWDSKNKVANLSGLPKELANPSEETYGYSPEAAKQIAESYNNKKIYFNHPDPKNPQRTVQDLFGKFIDVRWTPEGLYGTLVHLVSHSMTERVREDVQRGLGLFAMSHTVKSKKAKLDSGKLVFTDWEPHTVDLVDFASTTSNLFESEKPTVTTKTIGLILSENKFSTPITPSVAQLQVTLTEGMTNLQQVKEALIEMLRQDMEDETMEQLKERLMEAFQEPDGDGASQTEGGSGEECETPMNKKESQDPPKPDLQESQEVLTLRASNLLRDRGRWTEDDTTNSSRIKALVPLMESAQPSAEAIALCESFQADAASRRPDSSPPQKGSNGISQTTRKRFEELSAKSRKRRF